MGNYILETKDLSFKGIRYQDIVIEENKVSFIVGRSGTGKSTLLRLFNGMLSPDTGTITYHGKDIEGIDTIALRREILLISQSVYLFDVSIRENFREFYGYRGMEMPTEKEMVDFLAMCRITFPLDKDTSNMSGGEKQRVYMAIYLSFLPRVVMLDEPTSALDRENGLDVIRNA
ncbi:MAG TPA: ATP-binding cassette domain-containing protein, partial [Clostridiaceae bacterium]|nr:ATP-binding cassette domain-containing protein [Clostridiaceae bacterium]